MKTKIKTTEKKETAKNESNLDFKKGILGKFVSKKQANRKQKKPKNMIFSNKGLTDKKQRKNGILKGKTKGKQK